MPPAPADRLNVPQLDGPPFVAFRLALLHRLATATECGASAQAARRAPCSPAGTLRRHPLALRGAILFRRCVYHALAMRTTRATFGRRRKRDPGTWSGWFVRADIGTACIDATAALSKGFPDRPILDIKARYAWTRSRLA